MAYILQQLLSKSAARFPEKTAVWARGKSISYRELQGRSRGLVFSKVRGVDRQHVWRSESWWSLCSA
jgi:non-ribosomal peptide synthetase component E (peptide arylation enzyme)